MEKLVSIAMPVYNCSRYIRDAINSILRQTYQNWELIIVDDCSTDDTFEIVKSFRDSRISVVKNSSNKGLAECLNRCAELSRGEYYARMDGDDIMTVNRLELQVQYLENNPGVDLTGGLAYLIDQDNQVLGYKKTVSPRNIREVIKCQGFFIHPTVMGRIDWFKKNRYDAEVKRGQDFELWLRTYEQSVFVVLDEYLLFYREVGGNYRRKYYALYDSLKVILNKHRDKIMAWEYKAMLGKAYSKYLFFYLFKYLGLIQPDQQIEDDQKAKIMQELNKVAG